MKSKGASFDAFIDDKAEEHFRFRPVVTELKRSDRF